jgi:tRNA-dependent cyclodipeptide synthase
MHSGYRAKVVRSGRFHEFDTCFPPISLGSAAHEGDKLLATVEFVNSRFKACHVLVGDTLHRHNLRESELDSEAEARARARQLGNEWLQRSHRVLDRLSISLTISRWDEFLDDPEYPRRRSAIGQVYDASSAFRAAVTSDVTRYVRRNSTPANRQFQESQGVTFVLEEIAGISIQCQKVSAAEIYPGRGLAALRYIRVHNPAGIPSELFSRSFTQIGFVRRGSGESRGEELI